ncbi:dTMP kinase [Clostridium niameyense]|uniref:dTMP kinase n=1 Tax=Clostridium niameyense TaxID=1622073 RepID=UPI00067F61ED|nr:deoxynucleoside kinase [Clostridium niameyense]
MNKGKLIVIEGTDGSGKATQTSMLYETFLGRDLKVKKVEFPNYKSDSSSLIKMYLNGDFGDKPNSVNAYIASTFYAVDRFASYKVEWENFYNEGGIILADRYTTSNMIHQGAKIDDEKEKDYFLRWLWDLEFNKIKLPKPDCVIFLDMPPKYSKKLMSNRANKFTGGKEKDIHEKNDIYIKNSYDNAKYIANKYNWYRINCVDNDKVKTIDEIHKEIVNKLKEFI